MSIRADVDNLWAGGITTAKLSQDLSNKWIFSASELFDGSAIPKQDGMATLVSTCVESITE